MRNGKSGKEKHFLDKNVGKLTIFLQVFCACRNYSNMTNIYMSTRITGILILGMVVWVAQKDFLCKRLISLTKF